MEGIKSAFVIIYALSDSGTFVSSVLTGVRVEISPAGKPIGVIVGNMSGGNLIIMPLC